MSGKGQHQFASTHPIATSCARSKARMTASTPACSPEYGMRMVGGKVIPLRILLASIGPPLLAQY